MTPKQGRPADYIELMRTTAKQARAYVEGMAKEDFLADPKTQDAVILKLLVLGELAAKVLDEHAEFAAKHPTVPWRDMKGMRNRMAHGYFDTDLDIVWATVQTGIPALEASLQLF